MSAMQNCSPLWTFSRRYASTFRKTNAPNYKEFVKYKNKYEERGENRSAVQRLRNTAKHRIPFDKRFVVTGKDVSPRVIGGSDEAQQRVALHLVQPNGYIKKSGRFIRVKEMEPEFVVPDLKDCKLKPYVSYKATEINQSKLTARDLFDSCYAPDLIEQYQENKDASIAKKSVFSKLFGKKQDTDTDKSGSS